MKLTNGIVNMSGLIPRTGGFSSEELISLNKLAWVVILGSILISGMSHSAPAVRVERWNPYHYPTVRSITAVSALLSSRPRLLEQVTSTSTVPPTLITTQRPRPRPTKKLIRIPIRTTAKVLLGRSVINRRAAHHHHPDPLANNLLTPLDSPGSPVNGNQTLFGIDLANFDMGNATAINLALHEFIKSAEFVVRDVLSYTQNDLLRVIGQIDQGAAMFQKRIQSSGVRLAFAGQKAAATTYESLPSFVNKLLKRLITPTDGRSRETFTVQLNEAITNLRRLKKELVKAFEDHEKDFHEVFQERFTQINQYLRVPELPRRPLAWFT